VTVRVKICGVTRVADAAAIAAAGADYIGLNLWPRSKRHVTLDRAAELAEAIRAAGSTRVVGVFVDPTRHEVAAADRLALDVVQLHGDAHGIAASIERPVWRAVAAVAGLALPDLDAAEAVLLDTPSAERGGSGTTFDWSIAVAARRAHPAARIVLAGGLGPDNVRAAIEAVDPWAVDVASGVESAPGIKDLAKVTAFLDAVHRVS